MFKKIFFIILIFLIAGELLIRIDKKYLFFGENRVTQISTKLEITPEYKLLLADSINVHANNLRIMILGDSYIHGGGIDFKNVFSQQLKSILQKNNTQFNHIYVLDLSRASANAFDNQQTYYQFAEKFKPQIVILGYNYDDVLGELDQQIKKISIDSFGTQKSSAGAKKTMAKKISGFLYHSALLKYVLTKINTYLKTFGIVVPNSEFDLNMKSYYLNDSSWIQSKKIIDNMITHIKNNNGRLMVIKFPEINLLSYQNLFFKADTAIHAFFQQYPSVTFIDGTHIFKGVNSNDYILSRYDGHINEKGHKKLADYAAAVIDSMMKAQ